MTSRAAVLYLVLSTRYSDNAHLVLST